MKKRGVLIILLIAAAAVLFYGYRYINSPVKTKTAKLERLENVISANVFISRNEVVYTAETNGTLYNYVTEGARVGKNMLISTVYRGTVNEELVRELNNIDVKIEKLRKRVEQNETFTKDNSSTENKIEKVKSDIITAALNENYSKISEYKNSINYLSGGAQDTGAAEIADLSAQKTRMEAQLSNEKTDIYSTISGVFSDNADGYESVLTPEAIMNYRVGDYAKITAAEVRQRVSNEVNAGESVCKVADNHNWYVMTVLPEDKANELKEKKNVLIRFDDLPGEEVSATVEYVSEEEADETNRVVILKSDRYLEGVYSMRSGAMDIIINRYIGYKVPVYAVRTKDGKTGVMKALGNSEVFCECDIVFSDEENGSVIVYPSKDASRTLEVGDSIILGEKAKKGE